jgi:hypothetical protein
VLVKTLPSASSVGIVPRGFCMTATPHT